MAIRESQVAESIGQAVDALVMFLQTEAVPNRNGEPSNIADALCEIAFAIEQLARAVDRLGQKAD